MNKLSDEEKQYIMFQFQLISTNKIDSLKAKKIDEKKSSRNFILKNIIEGDINLYNSIPIQSIAFNKYNNALEKALEVNDTLLITESIKKIFTVLYKSRRALELFPEYLDTYKNYLYDDNEKATYLFYKNTIRSSLEQKERISELLNGLRIVGNTENNYLKIKYNQMIALQYQYFMNDLKNAIKYNKKAISYISSNSLKIIKDELLGLNINMGLIYSEMDSIKKSKYYLNKANKLKVPKYRLVEKVKLNDLFSKNSEKNKNYIEAYTYLLNANKYRDTLQEYEKAKALKELNIKYETEKKEKENLQLKQDNLISENKRKQNAYLFYGAVTFLLFGSIIAFLFLKNSRKKHQLAEQQKELEIQKNLSLIKEQEISTINAMVEGQEKERKLIAEDLHDNIGSVLATLKLHFENLKLNREKKQFNQEELYQKTEKLIDETYLKVRSLAHEKNAGVIANQSLLTAIKIMAEKISSANKTQIEVVHFGLGKRLENSLELTAFRIIQELTTNIIKHAEATKATINISQFNGDLNIILEDNGKGFNINKIELKNGMGLDSIKTRIEHLKGTFEVDSTLKKGTTVIINIPTENT